MADDDFAPDPELERFMTAIVYQRFTGDDLNTSIVGNLHSVTEEDDDEDGGGGGAVGFAPRVQRFTDASIVQSAEAGSVRDFVSAPHRFSATSEYRGDAFRIRMNGETLDTTFYSGGAFAPIPGLFKVTFDAKRCVGVRPENESMRVVKVHRLQCCPPNLTNVTLLLCHVFDMPAKAIREILSLGGYDCTDDRLKPDAGPALSAIDEANGIYDRPATGTTEPVIPCTSLSAGTMLRDGRTVNKALHKFELVRWLLERAEERLDPGKISPEYRQSAFEAFYELETLPYDERPKPRELKQIQDEHEYGTGYNEGHKWRPGPPLSIRFARHPLVVRFFGAGYFERLAEYHTIEWLSGLRVEEIYELYTATLCTRSDPGPPRYSTLYRQCFSSLLQERRSLGPSMDDFHDLVMLSYPHKNTDRTTAVPARELSYDNLAKLWLTGKRVRTVVTPPEVMDVFVYFVIQCLHYKEKHTCAHVRDVVNHCLFEMGESAARPFVESQKSSYNMTVKRIVEKRDARAFDLRSKILPSDVDPIRWILDSVEALARIGVIRIEALAEPLELGRFPIEVDSVLDLDRDGGGVVYLDRVHKIHRAIVHCIRRMTFCHADLALRNSLPRKTRFFEEAEKRGWSIDKQRRVADALNRMTAEQVEAAVVGRLLGDVDVGEDQEHLELAGEVSTPIYVSRFEPCSEQRLVDHCVATRPITNVLGAPGSGKSVAMSRIFREYDWQRGEVVGLAFMGAHVNSLRKAIGIPNAPVLTVHQFLMCHARTCCNEPDLMDDARTARLRMAKREKNYPFFGPLCYPEPTYGNCCCSRLHTVVIDEVGVMYEELFCQLLVVLNRCASASFCRLVTGGDLLQMPPISPGHIARELVIGAGCIPMEHGHRFDNQGLVQLGRSILEGDLDNIEIDDGESKLYRECAANWRNPVTTESDPVNVVEELYRDGTLDYLESMVICDGNKLANKLARHIDSYHLLAEARKKGKKAEQQLLRFYNGVDKDREAAHYGRPLLWRNCYFPGQKIIFGRNVASMGLTNKEQLVIISIVEGSYVHIEDTQLASLYIQLFGEICKAIRELADQLTGSGDGNQLLLERLADHYNAEKAASPDGRASNFVQIVRNHFYQGLKTYTRAQAEVQSLEGHALMRYEAMNFHRKEVHALKYGYGTGRSPLHRNPLCHRRHDGPRADVDAKSDLVRRISEEFRTERPELLEFSEAVIVDILRDVMTDLALEADISYERAANKLDEDGDSVGIRGRYLHPNHNALAVAVANQYHERNMKDKHVSPDDYIVFTPTATLAHSRAYGPGGKNADTIRFMQCHPLGDEESVVFIPIIKTYMERVKSASAVTIYSAQGSSAAKTALVAPYPLHVEDLATACTRAEECCVIVSNPFALHGTMARHHHARMSYLGAEIRSRCLIPCLDHEENPEEDALLTELWKLARYETAVSRRPGESRTNRNLRVSAFHKKYALVMPSDQVLPTKCLGPNNTDWVLEKLQASFPYLLYDKKSAAPVNELVSASEFDAREYVYQYLPPDEVDTMQGELSDSDDDDE